MCPIWKLVSILLSVYVSVQKYLLYTHNCTQKNTAYTKVKMSVRAHQSPERHFCLLKVTLR